MYFDSVNFDTMDAVFKEFPNEIFGFSLRMSPKSISESGICSHKINGQDVYSVNWKKANDCEPGSGTKFLLSSL